MLSISNIKYRSSLGLSIYIYNYINIYIING